MRDPELALLVDRAAISDVVIRYATAIDSRDWSLFRSCFSDPVDLDFTTSTATAPQRLTPGAWAARVRSVLSGFDSTQHLSTNHVHDIRGDEATCVSYMVASHCLIDGADRQLYTQGGYYTNELRRENGAWLIHRCVQKVTWETGPRSLFDIASARWQAAQPSSTL